MKNRTVLAGHKVIRDALSAEILHDFADYINLLKEHNRLEQDKSGLGVYGDFVGDSILMHLHPTIEASFGTKLFPTYSYIRIYVTNGLLTKHIDREACEFSSTLTIDYKADKIWPIYMRYNKENHEALLDKGEMLLYKGIEMPHWRDVFEGEYSMHIFMHYVEQEGELHSFKHDYRPVFSYTKDINKLLKNRLYSLQHLAQLTNKTILCRNTDFHFSIQEGFPFESMDFANKLSLKYPPNLRETMRTIANSLQAFSIESLELSKQEEIQLQFLIKQLVLNGMLEVVK